MMILARDDGRFLVPLSFCAAVHSIDLREAARMIRDNPDAELVPFGGEFYFVCDCVEAKRYRSLYEKLQRWALEVEFENLFWPLAQLAADLAEIERKIWLAKTGADDGEGG